MNKLELHATVATVIEEASDPTHATIDDVQAALAPMLQMTVDVQKQIAEHRGRLFAAQIAAPESDGHLERLHQTLRALETDVAAAQTALSRVRLSVLQYERYAKEIEAEYAPAAIIEPANPDAALDA